MSLESEKEKIKKMGLKSAQRNNDQELQFGRSYYGSIERGERNITFYTICEIAEKLNRDVAFFSQDIPPIKSGK